MIPADLPPDIVGVIYPPEGHEPEPFPMRTPFVSAILARDLAFIFRTWPSAN